MALSTFKMALSIKHPEVDRLARRLAETTGETLTEAVLQAIRERLVRVSGRKRDRGLADEVARIQARIRGLPVVDDRGPDELLGYDDDGLPA